MQALNLSLRNDNSSRMIELEWALFFNVIPWEHFDESIKFVYGSCIPLNWKSLFGIFLFAKKVKCLKLNFVILKSWICSNFCIHNPFWFSVLDRTKEEKAENVKVLEEEVDAAVDQDVERKAEVVDRRTAGMGEAGFSWESIEGEESHEVGEEYGGDTQTGGEEEKSKGE